MAVARYADLARTLVQEISSGQLQPGTRLPSEVELADQHQVSRSTVRSALTIVEGLGLVSRARRRGTVVTRSTPTVAYVRSITTLEDLVQYAAETERRVLTCEEVVCDIGLAARLGCDPGTTWFHVDLLRVDLTVPDSPVSYTELYLDAPISPELEAVVRSPHSLVIELVQGLTGRVVSRVDQDIRAIVLSDSSAALLNAEPGAPALAFRRRYYDHADELYMVTQSEHPADRFVYSHSINTQPPAHGMPEEPDVVHQPTRR